MQLAFWGTRGNIEARTRSHFKHAVLRIGYRGHRVAIDCGGDWLRQVYHWDVDAIVLTHAHPDHVDGLKNGAPCAVFATSETWNTIGRFPIHQQSIVRPRTPFRVGGLTVEAFAVEHSLRAPAVGYRVTASSADRRRAGAANLSADRQRRVWLSRGASLQATPEMWRVTDAKAPLAQPRRSAQ